MKTQKQQFIEHCDLIMDLSFNMAMKDENSHEFYKLFQDRIEAIQAFMKFFEEAVKK